MAEATVTGDSGSQMVQRLFGGPRRSCLSISCQPMGYFCFKKLIGFVMGRRPMHKSTEFFQSTSLVSDVSGVSIRCDFTQTLQLLGSGVTKDTRIGS